MKTPRAPFAAAFLAAFCLSVLSAAAGEKPVLSIYTWEEYFDPGVIKLFEEKNGCAVEFTYYDSNEAMFETISRGESGYDIITPQGEAIAALSKAGVILKLDHALLPNIRNIDPASPVLRVDAKMVYSVPYTGTVTGIGYNRKLVDRKEVENWSVFADAKYAKRMTMLNDMRENLGAALKHLGYSLNTTKAAEVQEAGELLLKWKKNLAMFSVDEGKEGLISGKYVVVQAYNGDILPYALENPDIGFAVPKEGSTLNSDEFVIGADTRNAKLAHAFINHMLDAGMAARNMQSICYYMPNAAAFKLLPAELCDHPAFHVGEEYMGTCEMVMSLGDAVTIYNEVWDGVLLEN